jgi:hypothetical protein
MKKLAKILSVCLCIAAQTFATPSEKCFNIANADTTVPLDVSTGKKSYEAIRGAAQQVKQGLFNVFAIDGNYYFDIGRELLGRELLLVTRISKGAASASNIYAGDEVSNMVISFELIQTNKVVIRKKIYNVNVSDSSAPMHTAVVRSNLMPIIAAFPVAAVSKDGNRICFNTNDYIAGDNEGMSLNPVMKASNSITGFVGDRSFISEVYAFPKNVELVLLKTYANTKQVLMQDLKAGTASETISFELNASIVELPAKPMRQRFEDDRVGYFALRQIDYDANPSGIKRRSFIKRWRLEPKNSDIERYKSGELVEPEKPIVFYIDPATPSKWVPYISQGVNDWQVAFEKAGFKNAIFAKLAPTKAEDSSWSLYDARHSAIVYKPSEIENASGPSICDPRSGEILESHINWYHNILQLLRNWYMVQCGVADPSARKMIFPDSLMGRLIRSAIAHEVGHALGLRHNMGASSTVPSNKLKDATWLEVNGICPSIMDYARYNYLAQPGDKIAQKDMIARIGAYDKWAIEWGYRLFYDYESAESETSFLNKWIISARTNPQLRFSSETSMDATSKTEDLGNDLELSNSVGIENLKMLMPHLIEWTKTPDESYDDLNMIYNAVQSQYITYLNHFLKFIGGVNETIKAVEESGPIYSPIPVLQQQQALKFLNTYFFRTPNWLIDTAILNRTGQSASGVIAQVQGEVLKRLLFPPLHFMSVSRNEVTYGKATYTLAEYFNDLKKYIWTELYTGEQIEFYRRSLQRTYIFFMLETFEISKGLFHRTFLPISGLTNITTHDVPAYVNAHLRQLLKDIEAKIKSTSDKPTLYHLQFLSDQLANAWSKKERK